MSFIGMSMNQRLERRYEMERRLVELDRDHPGFRDEHYRQRRDFIARIAHEHETGKPVPIAPYTSQEHDVWRSILDTLDPLHDVCCLFESMATRQTLDEETLADCNGRND